MLRFQTKRLGFHASKYVMQGYAPTPTRPNFKPCKPTFTTSHYFSNTTNPVKNTIHPAAEPKSYPSVMGLMAMSALSGALSSFAFSFYQLPTPAPAFVPVRFPLKHGPLVEESLLKVEKAPFAYAPNVPPQITRKEQRKLLLDLTCSVETAIISGSEKFELWPFSATGHKNEGMLPGPIVRARVGDVLEVTFRNDDESGMEHNIDFHAVDAPGGGANALNTASKDSTNATFRLTHPGFYGYHCAVGPVGVHIGRGMYGYMIVQPEDEEILPPVEKEFYVVQHEIYSDEPKTLEERKEAIEDGDDPDVVGFDFQAGLDENPRYVLFNGKAGSLLGDNSLVVDKGDRVRIYFGNNGPNKISAFHIIGATFDRVFNNGDFLSPPSRSVQTTLVAPGSACVVELDFDVPGKYTIVDHSIFRLEKGCVGFIKVNGEPAPELYRSSNPERPCASCKLH